MTMTEPSLVPGALGASGRIAAFFQKAQITP
ncbi:MAG: hypothetical protein RI949_3160, partial [Pseudomonadota bacterium]